MAAQNANSPDPSDGFCGTILDTNENEINLNLANYPIGIYAVVLIVDGQPVHAKQLIIN